MYTVEQIREMPVGSELRELVYTLTGLAVLDRDALRILECFCDKHQANWNLNSIDIDGNYSCDIYRDTDTPQCCGYKFGDTAALAIYRAIIVAAIQWRLV